MTEERLQTLVRGGVADYVSCTPSRVPSPPQQDQMEHRIPTDSRVSELIPQLVKLLVDPSDARLGEGLEAVGSALGLRCILYWVGDGGPQPLASYPADGLRAEVLSEEVAALSASDQAVTRSGDQLKPEAHLADGARSQQLWPLELGDAGSAVLAIESGEEELPDISTIAELMRVALALRLSKKERTAREALVRDLESQQELMGHIVDALPVGLYVVDKDYKIVAWNRKREAGTQGVARKDAIGRSVFEVLYRQPSERLKSELEEVFESNEIRHYEVESTASGEPRYYRLTKVPMRLGGTDDVTHVITVGEDLTEQKRISERISHAEKLAALGQMAAGVMHEINNPLATIAASAEALRESSEPHSEEMDLVSMIETEVDRCKRIARDLLAFSRPPPSEKGPVDVQETVEETLTLLRHHDRFKKLSVQREYVYDLPLIYANSERLVQVFVALALNALDAMEDDGELRVRTEVLDDGSGVGISFIDTGYGISASDIPKIFEPFYTSKSPGKGTGLGLSICYGIIVEHGGRIEVNSTIGVGSNFRVVLPAGELDEHGAPRASEEAETGG